MNGTGPDGLTPATAYNTITAAVSAAASGDTISIASGTYLTGFDFVLC